MNPLSMSQKVNSSPPGVFRKPNQFLFTMSTAQPVEPFSKFSSRCCTDLVLSAWGCLQKGRIHTSNNKLTSSKSFNFSSSNTGNRENTLKNELTKKIKSRNMTNEVFAMFDPTWDLNGFSKSANTSISSSHGAQAAMA